MTEESILEPGIVIVVPVFNDWSSAAVLIERLGDALEGEPGPVHLLIVDDGSTESKERLTEVLDKTSFEVTLLELVRNLGHQRAVAIGLCHAVTELEAGAVVVMDADGEDRPEDVRLLLKTLRANPHAVIVAQRDRRSEGLAFRFLYRVYRDLFSALTGTRITFGNFSAMSMKSARRLVSMHELLLHFPATIVQSHLPIRPVGTSRGKRYRGISKMGLIALIEHGFRSIAVFSGRALTRILVFFSVVFLLSAVAATTAVTFKFLDMASPGWTTTVAGVAMIALVQNAVVVLGGLLVVLNNKRDLAVLPLKIAPSFVARVIGLASSGADRALHELEGQPPGVAKSDS